MDSDYRGEWFILLNCVKGQGLIRPGDRIAQAVIKEVPKVALEIGEVADDTERGASGFGSTGV